MNPYDINGMKDAFLEADQLTRAEQSRRMRAMRKQVFDNDIDRWAERYLHDLREVNG